MTDDNPLGKRWAIFGCLCGTNHCLELARLASPVQERYSATMNTISEIESAVQKLSLEDVRALQNWLANYLRESEASLDRVVADTWEKLGPPPEVDYDRV